MEQAQGRQELRLEFAVFTSVSEFQLHTRSLQCRVQTAESTRVVTVHKIVVTQYCTVTAVKFSKLQKKLNNYCTVQTVLYKYNKKHMK